MAISLVFLMLAPLFADGDCCFKTQRADRQAYVLLLSAPGQGWSRPPSEQRLLRRIVSQPVEYVPVIETIIDAELRILEGGADEEDLRALGIADGNMYEMLRATYAQAQPLRRIRSALGLLILVNPPSADAYIGKVFIELERIRAQEADPEERRKLRRMQNELLHVFEDWWHALEDRRVAGVFLRRLSEMEPEDRGGYYLYLQKHAIGNEWIVQKLKAMADDEKNPLHDDPHLTETIQVLTDPSAESQRLVRQLKSYYENPASTLHQNPELKEVIEKLPTAERALETERRAAEAERRARKAKQLAEASREEEVRRLAKAENPHRGPYAEVLKDHVDAFRLIIAYRGPNEKGRYYSLWLGVPEPPETPCSRCLAVRISKAQAKKIIEHLEETGFLLRALLYPRKLLLPPKEPYYSLRVGAKIPLDALHRWGIPREDVVVGPELVKRLKSLLAVCEGEAAEALGRLIKPLEAEVGESKK